MDLSIIQGPFPVAVPNPNITIRIFFIAVGGRAWGCGERARLAARVFSSGTTPRPHDGNVCDNNNVRSDAGGAGERGAAAQAGQLPAAKRRQCGTTPGPKPNPRPLRASCEGTSSSKMHPAGAVVTWRGGWRWRRAASPVRAYEDGPVAWRPVSVVVGRTSGVR